MLLMPVSCHLARCYCKLYHNTKAINYLTIFVRYFIRFTSCRHNLAQSLLIHF